jgi:cytochrome P450
MMLPPKPPSRDGDVSLWKYAKLFGKDIFSSQPAKLYRAWMAEFRTPFFRSYLVNQPDLINRILKEKPDTFPKSSRIAEGLRPLLGNSVFLTNGEQWKRQRRIIDPAFEGGRLRDIYPAIWAAGLDAVERLNNDASKQNLEVEEVTSHLAADVIFRTLFSIPISDRIAQDVFVEFREYQRTQPILNIAAFLPLPKWMPRFCKSQTTKSAAKIRSLIKQLTDKRADEIAQGTAPDDLATKIMTTTDPVSGQGFKTSEMVDQVAIFFLAGHETSASALSWALYMMALYPDIQTRVRDEVTPVLDEGPDFSKLSKMRFARDVFREVLRLYPPVPMMVRSNTKPEDFRGRSVKPGSQIVLSPWHLQRHERLWKNPDHFDPDRWQTEAGKQSARDAYMPFSAGSRVCTGAGFAMVEGVLLLAMLVKNFQIERIEGRDPVPVAHLTVRSKDGIWLKLIPVAEAP